jgi:hypothetical protein
MKHLILILGAAALLGCSGDGVVGDWKSAKPTLDSFNELSVEEDGSGRAKLFIYRVVSGVATASPFVFDIEWRERETLIDFDFSCTESPFGDGTCDDVDSFDLNCDLDDSSDVLEMSCDANAEANWKDYGFDWRKIVEE